MCSSSQSKPASTASSVARTKASRTRSMSARSIARGVGQSARKGSAEGARVCQAPSSALSGTSSPSQGCRTSPCGRRAPAGCRSSPPNCRARSRRSASRRRRARARYMPAQPGVMRPSALTSVISVMTSPAPPTARLPRWTRCQSPTVPSTAEYWHIGQTTTRLASSSPRSRSGVNIGGGAWPSRVGRRADARARNHRVDPRDQLRVAPAQVVVGDPLRARHQVEGELDRVLAQVALRVLEPLEAGLGRLLQLDDVDPARVLVGRERRRHVGGADARGRPRRGRSRPPSPAWCPSRSRSGRCGRRRPAARRCPWCQVSQRTVGNGRQSERLASSRWPSSSSAKSLSPKATVSSSRGLVQPGAPPGLLVALDDPGAQPVVERVGVHLEQPVLALLEDEGERVERLVVPSQLKRHWRQSSRARKCVGVRLAHRAVDAVGAEDQVGVGELLGPADLALEVQLDPQLAAALAGGSAAASCATAPRSRARSRPRSSPP